jgi:hypothetical protein
MPPPGSPKADRGFILTRGRLDAIEIRPRIPVIEDAAEAWSHV